MRITDWEVDEKTGEYVLDKDGNKVELVVIDEGDWSVIVFHKDGRIEALTAELDPQSEAPYDAVVMGAVMTHIVKDKNLDDLVENMHNEILGRRGTLQ